MKYEALFVRSTNNPILNAAFRTGPRCCSAGLKTAVATRTSARHAPPTAWAAGSSIRSWFGKGGPGVSLALTEDFRHFERCGQVMQPDDKDAALLPRRIGGMFAPVHRPVGDSGAHVWISYSPDLRSWGGHQMMLPARRGAWWDANKVGLSPPLIETERGWLMLYHGVRMTGAGCLYRLGVANVTFPCGTTVAPDGDTLNLYYGAADTSVALAKGSIGGILRWLEAHASSS